MASNRTLGDLLSAARTLLNDTDNTNPAYRYSNAQLLEALNDAFLEARAKRPDLFLGTFGLRATLTGLALARQHPGLDLVLLDLNLPGLHGLPALQRPKAAE